MHTPLGCFTMAAKKDIPQVRLGIQGYPGTGKTWSAVTSFPNPVVANCDRGLGAHVGNNSIIEVPFYDHAFCRQFLPNPSAIYFPWMLKDIIYKWLETEAMKLDPDQTLVWDGNTGMQNAFHKWYSKNPVITSGGEQDGRAEWGLKKKYYAETIEMLKSLRCHVVFICHEADAKEKDGTYKGKIRPLLSGAFGDELVGHFTDWFRQLAFDKPTTANPIQPVELVKWGMTAPEFDTFLKQFPRGTYYAWQTESDSIFDGKCSSLVNFPRYIPADFKSFEKYRRKV